MKSRKRKTVSEDRLTINRRVTRSMSVKNGNDNSLPIPIDIIILIFSRLELKSIARCRCVCKLWASIFRRPDFTELFFTRSCSRTPKLLFAYHKNCELLIFSSAQPQNPDENSSPVVPNYQVKFFFDGYFGQSQHVNGLIFLQALRIFKGKKEMVLKICNPSTGQALIFPVTTPGYRWWSLFGYDPIGKQFKVLGMSKKQGNCEECQVLTLGSGNMSWRMIDCIPHSPPRQKICINGVMYYMSTDQLTETCLLVCFDFRFEKFSFIKTTEIMKRAISSDKTMVLINYNGKLGLLQCEEDINFVFLNGRSLSLKLWVLEDLEKQVWSEHTFLFPTVPENIVGEVRFVGVTQTNEIVLSSSKYKCHPLYLVYLNLEKKTIVKVTIEGMEVVEAAERGIHHTFLDHVENVELFGSV